jgi:hypothetical protein
MECAKIKELLSEYIDQILDFKTNEIIKEHLSSCKMCSEELSALESCIRNVSSLKQVQAPEDFLQRVHERIERRFEFEKIMRKLFIPPKVKIPLEFAGVLATVVLVIMVYRLIQPSEQMRVSPVIVEPQEMFDKSKQKPLMIFNREILFDNQIRSRTSYGLIEGLSISNGITTQQGIWSTRNMVEGLPANADLGKEFRSGIQSSYRGTTQYFFENALKSPYKEEYNKEFSKIKNIIESLKGTIVFVQFKKEANLLESVNARIPSQNYSALIEKLKEIGISEESLVSVITKDEESIGVRIKLIPSK